MRSNEPIYTGNLTSSKAEDDRPIGIFDSGLGGLTVLKEVTKLMPSEPTIYVGDSARCPYGPRKLNEVKGFVLEICRFLSDKDCKLIIIACNTATAAGLRDAQIAFDVPIIGVVEPGSRAATQITRKRQVGVIATEGTVSSNAYDDAIHAIDAGVRVLSIATPEFVEIAEHGLTSDDGFDFEKYRDIAHMHIDPLVDSAIDTLVMGCTHFPLIEPLIREAAGEGIVLVSSAEETAKDALSVLSRKGMLSNLDPSKAPHDFYTTSTELDEFRDLGSKILGRRIEKVDHVRFQ